jgi:Domain of unknown function (DUF4159)
MRQSIITFLSLAAAFLAGCCCTPQSPPPAVAPVQSPDAIDTASDQLQKYLLSYQATWLLNPPAANDAVELHRQALVVYALLSAGESVDDPHLTLSVAYVVNAPNPDPFVRGLRLRILRLLALDPDHRPFQQLAQADAAALMQSVHVNDPLAGMWSAAPDPYGPWAEATNPIEVRDDVFATESALAGLSDASEMGANIPDPFWLFVQQRIRDAQCADGAWTYLNSAAPGGVISPAVTLANLHALLIIRPHLMGARGLDCAGNITDDPIDNASNWVCKHFDDFNTLGEYWAIQQIAEKSGFRYFGRIDWFAVIAPRVMGLPASTEKNGGDPVVAASLNLLFLSNSSAPVIINKLEYPRNGHRGVGNWNERPLDVMNLTHWISEETEAPLNWQIANLEFSLDDLHDSPILYLAGDKPLRLSNAQIAQLREFVLGGGMILGNADCNSAAFKNSFTALGQKVFPAYQFRQLPRTDLIFQENHAKFRGTPVVLGLSNGVRELMLLMPGDPSRSWQASVLFGRNVDAFQLGMNIVLYATDVFRLHGKYDSYLVHPDPAVKPTRTIRLARLMVGDNPDPEPGGWPRLAAILHNEPFKVDLQVTPMKPGDGLAGYSIVHLTGTTKFTLTPAIRQSLVDFTATGGTLIIDAAGGSKDFADAAEKELGIMFGNGAGNGLTWLPPGCLLYTLPQAPILECSYRRFARNTLAAGLRKPMVQGVWRNGRYVAFFSRGDLSAGLVGEPVDGIMGYSPETATALMRNMILYSAMR